MMSTPDILARKAAPQARDASATRGQVARCSRPQKALIAARLKAVEAMSDVASPPWASRAGQKTARTSATTPARGPNKPRVQRQISQTVRAPSSAIMARAQSSILSTGLPRSWKNTPPKVLAWEFSQPGWLNGGVSRSSRSNGRAARRWGRFPFSGCRR